MEKNTISCLKDFQFKYKNKNISINLLDELIIKSIQETYNKNDQRSSLNITIDDEITIVYILITIGIISYYENMKDPENNILDSISQGAKVCYKREIYTFEGCEEFKDKKYIKLKNKSLINRVPIANAYEITTYNGDATRINKKKGLDIKNKSNITKAFIAHFMKVDIGELNGRVEKSNLIVVKGKEKIIDIVKSISIVFGERNIPFSELFSIAYWTSSESEPLILQNSLKEDILFNITTNITTGLDIVSSNENIKNIFIIGEKSYKDSYETELRAFNLFCDIEKLMIFNTWEDESEYEYFLDQENEFDISAFTKGFLENSVKGKILKCSEVQKKYYDRANILVNKEKKINFVIGADKFNDDINDAISSLGELRNYSENNDDVLQFLKIAYHLCNKFQNSIIPLRYCFEKKNNILEKIELLEDKKSGFHGTRSEYKIMEDIINRLYIIVESLNDTNGKFATIKKAIKSQQNGVILLKNKKEIDITKYYFSINGIRNLSYEVLKKEQDFSKYEYVIVPFYINSNSLLENNSIKKIEIISYKREFYKYRNDFKKNERMMKLICEKNILKENDIFDSEVKYINLPKVELNLEIEEEKNIIQENKMKKMLDDNYIKLLVSADYNFGNQSYQNNQTVAKKIIIIKSGDYAFLTENYRINCIDRRKNDINTKTVDEIELGDEIIFVRNINNDKTDIVKDIIDKLLNEKDFKNLYGKFFEQNKLWKTSLIKYMESNELEERDISKKLKSEGQDVNPLTIKNWLNGNIIGPRDSNNIKMIAKIIDDKELLRKTNDISKACIEVRSLQIRVRKIIAKMIINSVINQYEEENEIYKLVTEVVGDLSSYAYIGEITEIQKINKEISNQYTNKIIEGEKIDE